MEYVLSLGVGSAAVPLSAFLQRAELGFDLQFSGLTVSSVFMFTAGLFLPKPDRASLNEATTNA